MEIEIKGHSGCQIEVANEKDNLYIYKRTNDSQYVNRLFRQAEKQKDAAKVEYQHIRIPKIHDIRKTENTLSIKMEYIYSKNFIDFFEDAGFEQINYFIYALKSFIDFEISHSPICCINKEIIIDKFENVCKNITHNNLISNDTEIAPLMQLSSKVFYGLHEKLQIPIGKCHGDLTFSNILFNGNNYFLIDFLDSFIESPLLDIIKVRQDSSYGWSQLMYEHSFDKTRMKIIHQYIDKEIDAYYKKKEWYVNYYMPLQLMNFLRILQYAKKKEIIIYLKNVLNSIICQLN